jgi:hypothetical protein
MFSRSSAVVAAAVIVLSLAPPAAAQNKCQGAKIRDAVKKAACIAALQAKRVSTGMAIDSSKLAKCQAKVTDAYPKLEAKGNCKTTNDAAAIEQKVDAFVTDLVNELDVGSSNCPGSPCTTSGGSCGMDSDCCSGHCDLTLSPPSCAYSIAAGGCCQTANDCGFSTTCTGGRCDCLPSNGPTCGNNAQCCSNNCPTLGAGPCQ